MKHLRPLYAVIAVFFLIISCQSEQHQHQHDANRGETAALTPEDSLYKEVVAVHDEVMPKMGKLIGFKKTIQAKIDSLEHLAKGKTDAVTTETREKYQNALSQLEAAEKGMNEWMEQFDWEKKLAGKEDLVKYYEDQKLKATKMKEDLLAALENAAQL